MKSSKISYSLYSLLIANIITIAFAIFEGWDVSTVIWIYWFQSIIIGFFQFIKILDLKNFSTDNFQIGGRSVKPTTQTKCHTALFFLFHYGFFHFIYMIFLLDEMARPDWQTIAVLSGMFFLNHLISYKINKYADEQEIKNIGEMMFFPYIRILPMHAIIMCGLFIIGSSVYLVFFLMLKTAADVMMHMAEHMGMKNFLKKAEKYIGKI